MAFSSQVVSDTMFSRSGRSLLQHVEFTLFTIPPSDKYMAFYFLHILQKKKKKKKMKIIFEVTN
jgi:hypothetical protein